MIRYFKLSSIAVTFYWCVYALEIHGGIKLEFSGDEIDAYTNGLFMCNHICNIDFLILSSIAYRKGMLSFLKYLAKKELTYIPFFGFPGMVLSEMILLNRNWQTDQSEIQNKIYSLLKDNIPCYLIIFPEGTRLNAQKLKMANDFAKERNLKETEKVVLPRVKGLKLIMDSLKNLLNTKNPTKNHTKNNSSINENHNNEIDNAKDQFKMEGINTVYDITFGYPPNLNFVKEKQNAKSIYPILDVIDLLMNLAQGVKICVNVKKIKLETIPTENEETFKDWIYERFYRKDEMLKEMEVNANRKLKKWKEDKQSEMNDSSLLYITQKELSEMYEFVGEKVVDEPLRFVPFWKRIKL
ncbi:hypothetical protein ABK040_008643 [Willaertia magna]